MRKVLAIASVVSLGAGGTALAADLPLKAKPVAIAPVSLWEVEVGARTWFSSGTIGAPQPLLNSPGNILASRLLYKDENAFSGELFARLDHKSGFFVKGNVGIGRITSGNMYDEDFPTGGAYSNTLQNNNKGHILYGTGDVGYNFITGPGAKIGAFVGYNYYGQHVDTFGCTQLAGSAACQPAGSFPAFFNGISEDDAFGSLRIGISTQFKLTDRLRLSAEAAYLPYVQFWGTDNHNARSLIINETADRGDGVQLEAALDYAVTENWNIGVGGRYWAWNTTNGNTQFNFIAPPSQFNEPARFSTERWGVFTQASYHWGDVTPRAAAAALPYKAQPVAMFTNWTGFYVGGYVGGGFGNDRWSDPFPSNFIAGGGVTGNIAGFGDKTRATGPLGGGQVGYNFQAGKFVYGVELDGGLAALRGENSCFTGLGGVNCQRIVNALGTLAGRLGYAWDRSLVYVKGGAAFNDTTYKINGNTNALALGTASVDQTTAGWMVGVGIEYAVTQKWSAKAEYNYMNFSTSPRFTTVTLVGAQPTRINDDMNVFKVGFNYKLAPGAVVAKY